MDEGELEGRAQWGIEVGEWEKRQLKGKGCERGRRGRRVAAEEDEKKGKAEVK